MGLGHLTIGIEDHVSWGDKKGKDYKRLISTNEYPLRTNEFPTNDLNRVEVSLNLLQK